VFLGFGGAGLFKVFNGNVYYALLSGAHATLPLAELRGILEAYNVEYRVLEVHHQLVLFSSSKNPSFVVDRAGMVHEVGRVLAVSEASEPTVLDVCESARVWEAVDGRRFVVRFERLRGYSKETIDNSVVRKIGELVLSRCRGCRVDVRSPDVVLRVVVSEGVAVVGVRLAVLDLKPLLARRPHLKPFYHPGALDPRLSRVFVNLSRAPPGGLYYDPFCGTGGFAVEALIGGVNVVCSDIDSRLVGGSLKNISAYSDYARSYPLSIVQADAVRMPLRDEVVDAIGTDPPYGRSISTRGRRLEDILRGFLEEAAVVLKRGRWLAFAVPHWVEPRDLVVDVGLELLETHFMRVHGGLTRILVVARKP